MLVALPALLVGCRDGQVASLKLPAPAKALASAVARKPAFDAHKVRPNELGLIPIVMYHDIGAASAGRRSRFDREGLNIRPETFRKQLQLMYEAGWYPVVMRDALKPSIQVPSGKIPVVLTFDDARGTQFRYRPDGSMDPNCAVAILQEFHKAHQSDWPLRATFFVMPASTWNPPPFHQAKSAAQKLKFLVDNGCEIANHSTTHKSMARMDSRNLQWEVAECVRGIRKLAPEASMDTLALPYGEEPRDKNLLGVLLKGFDGDTAYTNQCVLIAWGGPSYPRAHKKFDRRSLTRIGVPPGHLEKWIRTLKPGKILQPYVSDGDPYFLSVPRSLEKLVNRKALGETELFVWNDQPSKPVQKVARGADRARPSAR